jgi:nitrate reductase gamma subunit
MDLLSFARGPALQFALVVFFLGVAWRLVGITLLRTGKLLSEPRTTLGRALWGGFVTTGARSWPHKEFIGRTGAGEALGYSYHIGLFIVVLGFGPHIQTWAAFLGFDWPALPSGVITIISVITFALLLAVLFRRLTNRVLRLLSNFDDYFSWFINVLVILTGLLATAHWGGRYETLLALHILSFDVLLIWFPFGKLMHAFYIMPSRAINGYLLSRKGAPS